MTNLVAIAMRLTDREINLDSQLKLSQFKRVSSEIVIELTVVDYSR